MVTTLRASAVSAARAGATAIVPDGAGGAGAPVSSAIALSKRLRWPIETPGFSRSCSDRLGGWTVRPDRRRAPSTAGARPPVTRLRARGLAPEGRALLPRSEGAHRSRRSTFSSASAGAPHEGQATESPAPHSMQKRRSTRLSWSQDGQRIACVLALREYHARQARRNAAPSGRRRPARNQNIRTVGRVWDANGRSAGRRVAGAADATPRVSPSAEGWQAGARIPLRAVARRQPPLALSFPA